MNKYLVSMLLVGCMSLAFVGCKKSASAWYPISGGYINLDNVGRITSQASMLLWSDEDKKETYYGFKIEKDTILDGPITEEGIDNAIKKLTESKKKYSHGNFSAAILLDDFTVRLQDIDDISWNENKDLVQLLKMWQKSMDDLGSRL